MLATRMRHAAAGLAVEIDLDGGHTPTTTGSNHQNVTNFDDTFSIPNNAEVIGISYYSTVVGTIHVKIGEDLTSTTFDVTVSESFSHGGTGWERHDLSSSYDVPASGTFRAGSYQNLSSVEVATGTPAHIRKDGNQGTASSTTGWTSATTAGKLGVVRVHYFA